MPTEGNADLYGLRPSYYNKYTNTYSPPGGKTYTYTNYITGAYDTYYGCYGGFYYNVGT